MIFPDRIDYKMECDDFSLPRMFSARQLFRSDRLDDDDIPAAVRAQLAKLPLSRLAGKRVALTASSRGVANQALILKTTAAFLKENGVQPFIVPGMGSHAGATAQGQKDFVAGYGITEEAMGVPILSSMEVALLGTTASGFPVYCDAFAANADAILPIHRIKPHTDFKGAVESGLCKMLVIGLGKHKGATQLHRLGPSVFANRILEAAAVFFATGKILGGLAIVENAYDETMILEAVPTDAIVQREKELLALAKSAMAKFHTDAIDVLVLEEIGKDISGAGMDSNITARPVTGEPGFFACPIRRIVLLGISGQSNGNGAGLGLADVVTTALMRQLDLAVTYTNALTARGLESVRIPMVANSDRDAVRIALHCGMGVEPAQAKIVQAANTLRLADIRMSEAYFPIIRDDPRFEILSEPEPMRFDAAGRLERLPH